MKKMIKAVFNLIDGGLWKLMTNWYSIVCYVGGPILILIAIFACSSQNGSIDGGNKRTDWFHDGLKGEVKQIEESYYGASGMLANVERGAFSHKTTIHYDQKGFLTDQSQPVKVHYNAEGLKDTVINLDSNGSMHSKFVNEFGKDGLVTQTRMFESNGNPIYTWVYEYDANDNVVKEGLYNAVGTQLSVNVFSYNFDDKGNWIRKFVLSSQNQEVLQIIERTITYY
ncbi:MAG: hypothetical protein LBL74_08750 [Bacteroidales bacterium]|jgi:hypothetical protein|nr:hypothetical protein [Bacteroidales bacterium]